MKIIGKAFVILGIAAILPAGFVLVRDMSQAHEHDTNIANMTEERAELRGELHKLNLEFRGYQESISSIPDSVLKDTAAEVLAKSREYTARIRSRTMQEKELSRLIMRQNTKKGELLAGTRRFSGGLGGGGIVLMLIGFLLVRRGGR